MRNQATRTGRGALRALVALGFALTLGACSSTVRISELLAQPSRYDGREVQVQGRVTRGAGILGVGGYELDDGTGQIVVIAQGTGVPAQGSETKVKGTFQSIFSFGGRSIAAILQEQRTTPQQ
jgi:hypothetical protein